MPPKQDLFPGFNTNGAASSAFSSPSGSPAPTAGAAASGHRSNTNRAVRTGGRGGGGNALTRAGALGEGSISNTVDTDEEGGSAADRERRAKRFEINLPGNRCKELQIQHDKERARYIAQGDIADPNNPGRRVKEFRATATGMCPLMEIEAREYGAQIEMKWELKEGTTNRIDHTKAVKVFHRPSDVPPPLPSDVRTPEALRQTLNYLFQKIISSDPNLFVSHPFIRDRTRAIRQDFTYQVGSLREDLYNTSLPTTPQDPPPTPTLEGADVTGGKRDKGFRIMIECHERIARYHLHCLHLLSQTSGFSPQQELEQLRKVLQSLWEMYPVFHQLKLPPPPNEGEFCAYFLLSHMDEPDIIRQIEALPSSVYCSQPIQLAVKIRALAARGNEMRDRDRPKNQQISQNFFTAFFKTVASPSTPYLAACLCESYFGDVRLGALRSLSGAFNRPSNPATYKGFPIGEVRRLLACDDDEQAAAVCEDYSLKVTRDVSSGAPISVELFRKVLTDDKRLGYSQRFSKMVDSKRVHLSDLDIIQGVANTRTLTEGVLSVSAARPSTQSSTSSPSLFTTPGNFKFGTAAAAFGSNPYQPRSLSSSSSAAATPPLPLMASSLASTSAVPFPTFPKATTSAQLAQPTANPPSNFPDFQFGGPVAFESRAPTQPHAQPVTPSGVFEFPTQLQRPTLPSFEEAVRQPPRFNAQNHPSTVASAFGVTSILQLDTNPTAQPSSPKSYHATSSPSNPFAKSSPTIKQQRSPISEASPFLTPATSSPILKQSPVAVTEHAASLEHSDIVPTVIPSPQVPYAPSALSNQSEANEENWKEAEKEPTAPPKPVGPPLEDGDKQRDLWLKLNALRHLQGVLEMRKADRLSREEYLRTVRNLDLAEEGVLDYSEDDIFVDPYSRMDWQMAAVDAVTAGEKLKRASSILNTRFVRKLTFIRFISFIRALSPQIALLFNEAISLLNVSYDNWELWRELLDVAVEAINEMHREVTMAFQSRGPGVYPPLPPFKISDRTSACRFLFDYLDDPEYALAPEIDLLRSDISLAQHAGAEPPTQQFLELLLQRMLQGLEAWFDKPKPQRLSLQEVHATFSNYVERQRELMGDIYGRHMNDFTSSVATTPEPVVLILEPVPTYSNPKKRSHDSMDSLDDIAKDNPVYKLRRIMRECNSLMGV